MSPNYPANYPNNIRCRWMLVVDRNEQIRIKFSDFDVEDSSTCTRDRLTFEDVNLSVRSYFLLL